MPTMKQGIGLGMDEEEIAEIEEAERRGDDLSMVQKNGEAQILWDCVVWRRGQQDQPCRTTRNGCEFIDGGSPGRPLGAAGRPCNYKDIGEVGIPAELEGAAVLIQELEIRGSFGGEGGLGEDNEQEAGRGESV